MNSQVRWPTLANLDGRDMPDSVNQHGPAVFDKRLASRPMDARYGPTIFCNRQLHTPSPVALAITERVLLLQSQSSSSVQAKDCGNVIRASSSSGAAAIKRALASASNREIVARNGMLATAAPCTPCRGTVTLNGLVFHHFVLSLNRQGPGVCLVVMQHPRCRNADFVALQLGCAAAGLVG